MITNSVQNQKSKGKKNPKTGAEQTRVFTEIRGRIRCHGFIHVINTKQIIPVITNVIMKIPVENLHFLMIKSIN